MKRRLTTLVVSGCVVAGGLTLAGLGRPSDDGGLEAPLARFVEGAKPVLPDEVKVMCVTSSRDLDPVDVAFEARQGLAVRIIRPRHRAIVSGRRVEVLPDTSPRAERRWCVAYAGSSAADDDLSFVWRDEILATARITAVTGRALAP